jgi:hypothetical protein
VVFLTTYQHTRTHPHPPEAAGRDHAGRLSRLLDPVSPNSAATPTMCTCWSTSHQARPLPASELPTRACPPSPGRLAGTPINVLRQYIHQQHQPARTRLHQRRARRVRVGLHHRPEGRRTGPHSGSRSWISHRPERIHDGQRSRLHVRELGVRSPRQDGSVAVGPRKLRQPAHLGRGPCLTVEAIRSASSRSTRTQFCADTGRLSLSEVHSQTGHTKRSEPGNGGDHTRTTRPTRPLRSVTHRAPGN